MRVPCAARAVMLSLPFPGSALTVTPLSLAQAWTGQRASLRLQGKQQLPGQARERKCQQGEGQTSAVTVGAAVEGLYEGTVPGDAASAQRGQVAAEALKQVVVRLTGRWSAPADAALAAVFAEPLKYAQTYRSLAQGQVAVGFDARGLDAALLAAGQRLWPRERPATLLVVVGDRPGAPPALVPADPDLKRELERTAQLRGLPVVWVTGLDAATLQARLADATAGRLEPLRSLARQFGADGVLLGRGAGAGGGASWSWLGPAGTGSFSGTAAEALHTLADRYGAQFATQAAAPGGVLGVAVRGVRDLQGYAQATQLLAALEGVRDVAIEEVAGDTLRFRVAFAGDAETLKQTAAQSGRLLADQEAPADGAVHFVLRP